MCISRSSGVESNAFAKACQKKIMTYVKICVYVIHSILTCLVKNVMLDLLTQA